MANLKKEMPNSFVMKISDKWYSGMPDVMQICDGQVFFYELKSKNGVVSEIQKQTHNELRRAGAYVDIVRG